jgi:hypothetical protein
MGEQVKIERTVYGKAGYSNVVDISFRQIVPTPPAISEIPIIGVKEFFQYYDQLFYDIPSSGSLSGSLGFSHLDIVNRSSEYIGISVQDMEQEIINLRSENVALQRQIFTITQSSGSL